MPTMRNKEPPYVYDRSLLPELLTVVEAANFLRASEQTVRNRVHDGKITALVDEDLIRIHRSSVLKYARLEESA